MHFNTKYKKWTWKSFFMLHWVINPAFAFNELILGQRGPKVLLIEKKQDKTFAERTFVPCPHCGTIHSGLKWTPQNKTAFGNWFGLYCDHCGKIIPCLRNFTSFIIIAITFPIWIWFQKRWKEKWLIKQKEKFSKPLKLTPPNFIVWVEGIKIGLTYYLLTMVLKFVVFEEVLTWKKPIGNFVGSIIIGLVSASIIKEIGFKKKSVVHN
jgi:hypothetical protein